ncbi:hypothetical protein M885DRAFT_93758 [Pelagophyceae sp. CCMP2097]|nr:hypothetical protein M885DRAFT_93758 [Pelagophyceae sp. CCMP2097]
MPALSDDGLRVGTVAAARPRRPSTAPRRPAHHGATSQRPASAAAGPTQGPNGPAAPDPRFADLADRARASTTAAPRRDTPRGDTPRGNTPRGDTPRGNMPRGDSPRGNTPRKNMPRGALRGDPPRSDPPRPRPPPPSAGGCAIGDARPASAAARRTVTTLAGARPRQRPPVSARARLETTAVDEGRELALFMARAERLTTMGALLGHDVRATAACLFAERAAAAAPEADAAEADATEDAPESEAAESAGAESDATDDGPADDFVSPEVATSRWEQPRPRKHVVRLGRAATPYCGHAAFAKLRAAEPTAFYSIVNDGTLYRSPHEIATDEARSKRLRWVGAHNFFADFGKSRALPTRKPGGVAGSG